MLGSISLILGPMFSGKTTELIRNIKRYSIANKKCIIYKHEMDNRYDNDKITTHDNVKWDAKCYNNLLNLLEESMEYDIIGIDEGQFFPDIVAFSEKLASCGKIIIIAALDADYKRNPFGRILDLIPLSENIIKLKAICGYCKNDASFTKRLIFSEKIELIGGSEIYMAVCRTCYIKKIE